MGEKETVGAGGRTSSFQYAQTDQSDEIVPGSDGRIVARITCYKCLKRGHFADFCLTDVVDGDQHLLDAEEFVEVEGVTELVNDLQVETIEEEGGDDVNLGEEIFLTNGHAMFTSERGRTISVRVMDH